MTRGVKSFWSAGRMRCMVFEASQEQKLLKVSNALSFELRLDEMHGRVLLKKELTIFSCRTKKAFADACYV